MTEDNRETEATKIEYQLNEGKRRVERDDFYRKHGSEIEKEVPKTEEFLKEFMGKFVQPYTRGERNPLLLQLEINKDEQGLIDIFQDAMILDELGKLIGSVNPYTVSGYESDQGTRPFTKNMIFVGFDGKVGKDGTLDRITALSEFLREEIIARVASSMNKDGVSVELIIDKDGRMFMRSLVGEDKEVGVNQDGGSRVSRRRELSEGDQEEDQDWNFLLTFGWDLENSRPVFMVLSGWPGLTGKSVGVTFAFGYEDGKGNPFPLPPLGVVGEPEVRERDGELEYKCVFESGGKRYLYTKKYRRLGKMMDHNGDEMVVWGLNGRWERSEKMEDDAI